MPELYWRNVDSQRLSGLKEINTFSPVRVPFESRRSVYNIESSYSMNENLLFLFPYGCTSLEIHFFISHDASCIWNSINDYLEGTEELLSVYFFFPSFLWIEILLVATGKLSKYQWDKIYGIYTINLRKSTLINKYFALKIYSKELFLLYKNNFSLGTNVKQILVTDIISNRYISLGKLVIPSIFHHVIKS